MAFEITMLGTSSMVPTKERNVQSIYLEYRGEGILFDCGEGTQRQMNIVGISRTKVKKILISHWHGDHVSGLIGLIQTLGNSKDVSELFIYGPLGTKNFMNNLLNSCIFDLTVSLNIMELDFDEKKVFFENEHYYLEASPLNHGVPCLGYSFVEKDKRKINLEKARRFGLDEGPDLGLIQKNLPVKKNGKMIMPDDVSSIQKGKKFTLISDTSFSANAQVLADGSDILICEATYDKNKEEKANEYSHLTSEQSALIASNAGVNKLVLTHFSQRYKDLDTLLDEAKNIFPNTVLAFDFMKIKL
jgi:ribonuclease Z